MANARKPNILFIMGDDIGWFNARCYNHGLMGVLECKATDKDDATADPVSRKTKEDAPWFCLFHPTRMHVFSPASRSFHRVRSPRVSRWIRSWRTSCRRLRERPRPPQCIRDVDQ